MRYGVFAAGVLAVGLAFASVAQAADGPHIAVANFQVVVNNCHHGQSVNDSLQKLADDLNSKIKDHRDKLDVLHTQLDKTDKKSKSYASLLDNYKQEAANFQQFAYIAQQQFDQTKQKNMQPVYDELSKVLTAYAKDHHYDIILNYSQTGAVYTTDQYNITSELTEAMDKDWAEMQKNQPADSKGK